MNWFRPTRTTVDPSRVEEAKAERDEAEAQLRRTLQQGFTIARISSYFAERRIKNGFGDDFDITLTPKEKHAS